MFCITLDSTNPFFNLAIEEILFKKSKDDYLILGINSPSVIIGKHQSGHREINQRFICENNIPVIRRISGGGTVYHDLGNINFTFIRQAVPGKQVDFRKYTQPVIDFLLSVGVKAKFEGKNDLKVEGLKISGNAEHVFRNRVLHHGTLLFSTDLKMLRNSLRNDTSFYITRGVSSNPSSVVNLNNLVNSFRDIFEFRSAMMSFFLETIAGTSFYQLSDTEIHQAEMLAASKYKTWEWNYAYGPEYRFSNIFHIGGKLHSFNIFVKEGIIRECKIDGSDQTEVVAEKLIGCRHMVPELLSVFNQGNIKLSKDEIYNLF